MDPQTCWIELQEAVITAMWGTAIIRAQNLLEWLESGGFPPKISGYPVFDRIIALSTCRTIFDLAM
jgi:hypothetical protein